MIADILLVSWRIYVVLRLRLFARRNRRALFSHLVSRGWQNWRSPAH